VFPRRPTSPPRKRAGFSLYRPTIKDPIQFDQSMAARWRLQGRCDRTPDRFARRARRQKPCQSRTRKIFRFSEIKTRCMVSPFRSDMRGVRVVTNVVRNAVDAILPIDVRRSRGRRSRVVPTPRRWRQVSRGLRRPAARRWWQSSIGSPRRARISRNPLRREGRCDHRLYLWFSRSRNFSLRGSPGCSGHPAFPAPSFSRG
jgi:hypothetical protein